MTAVDVLTALVDELTLAESALVLAASDGVAEGAQAYSDGWLDGYAEAVRFVRAERDAQAAS